MPHAVRYITLYLLPRYLQEYVRHVHLSICMTSPYCLSIYQNRIYVGTYILACRKTKQTNGWKPFLCAAPFFAVGENNCAAFFWGGFCFAAGFFFCVFFTKICLLIAFLHVCWSSFSATFLASCITFSASPYHVYKRIKRACKTHLLSIIRISKTTS